MLYGTIEHLEARANDAENLPVRSDEDLLLAYRNQADRSSFEGEHVYYVSSLNLLVHNMCAMANAEGGKGDGNTGTRRESSKQFTDGPSATVGTYAASPKHHKNSTGRISPPPTNGQRALDNSVSYSPNTKNRVAVDKVAGEYVVLSFTGNGLFHGHTRNWDDLTQQMKNALIKDGQVTLKGKIL